MKYCCVRMKQAIEKDELRDCGGRWWYSDISMWVYDCPFCMRCPYCERKYENKSDFYITITCDRETVKKKSTAEVLETLKDEFKAAISTAPQAIERFKRNVGGVNAKKIG